jgi:dihydrofolate reductase
MSHVAGPRVYLVAAVAANRVIGAHGKLPWHLPEDLRHFKSLTLGHPVIMGRRTWESLGKPLPGRENIVVTRAPGYKAPGAHVAASLEGALALCAGEPIAFVIGGAELYDAALPAADGLVMTEIHRDFDGDTRFPDYDRSAWRETQRKPQVGAGGLAFDFVLYERAARGGLDSNTRTSGSGKPLKPLA